MGAVLRWLLALGPPRAPPRLFFSSGSLRALLHCNSGDHCMTHTRLDAAALAGRQPRCRAEPAQRACACVRVRGRGVQSGPERCRHRATGRAGPGCWDALGGGESGGGSPFGDRKADRHRATSAERNGGCSARRCRAAPCDALTTLATVNINGQLPLALRGCRWRCLASIEK